MPCLFGALFSVREWHDVCLRDARDFAGYYALYVPIFPEPALRSRFWQRVRPARAFTRRDDASNSTEES